MLSICERLQPRPRRQISNSKGILDPARTAEGVENHRERTQSHSTGKKARAWGQGGRSESHPPEEEGAGACPSPHSERRLGCMPTSLLGEPDLCPLILGDSVDWCPILAWKIINMSRGPAWGSGCRAKAEELLPGNSLGRGGPDASSEPAMGLLRQRDWGGGVSSKELSKRASWGDKQPAGKRSWGATQEGRSHGAEPGSIHPR